MGWPTTDKPRTNFVTLRLTDDEAAALDAAAVERGMSRSAYVRAALTRVLKADSKKAAKAASSD